MSLAGRDLLRLNCPACEYQVAVITWCQDPACCEQDPRGFTESLAAAEAARGIPVFAVRFLPETSAEDAGAVDVWRAGNPVPTFSGPAAAAIEFQMRHDCPAGDRPGPATTR